MLAVLTGVGVPLAYLIANFAAKRFPATGELVLIVGAYCGIMLAFGVKVLRRKRWIER